jgi:hypothetical protein
MTSVVSICNLALSNMAKDNISDLDEASPEAKLCKQFYEHVRDTILQAYPWRFARKTASLAEIANTKEDRWLYAYRRPTDCLKVIRLNDANLADYLPYSDGIVGGAFAYDLEGTSLFCDLTPAYLEYTVRLEDPTKFPPLFVEALAWHLAVRLAMPITRDPKARADAYQLAMRMQNEAAVADANEVRETSDFASEMVEARGDGFRYDRYGRAVS